MDSRLQPEHADPSTLCVIREVLEHQFGKADPAKPGTDVHPLELPVRAVQKQDPATARRHAALTDEKEGHVFGEQFFQAVAMTAFSGVEGRKFRFQLTASASPDFFHELQAVAERVRYIDAVIARQRIVLDDE